MEAKAEAVVTLLSEGRDGVGYYKELDIRIRNGGDDAMAAALELVPRWIPVGERLPDDYGDVLCWYVDAATGEGHVGFGCCEPNPQTGEREWDIAGVFDPPTHWMPLPGPPLPSPPVSRPPETRQSLRR